MLDSTNNGQTHLSFTLEKNCLGISKFRIQVPISTHLQEKCSEMILSIKTRMSTFSGWQLCSSYTTFHLDSLSLNINFVDGLPEAFHQFPYPIWLEKPIIQLRNLFLINSDITTFHIGVLGGDEGIFALCETFQWSTLGDCSSFEIWFLCLESKGMRCENFQQ